MSESNPKTGPVAAKTRVKSVVAKPVPAPVAAKVEPVAPKPASLPAKPAFVATKPEPVMAKPAPEPVVATPAAAPVPAALAAPQIAAIAAIPQAPVEAAIAAKDMTMDTINTATDKTQAMFAGMNDRAKGAMEKGAAMLEEMSAFNKGNLEALVESSKIAVKGIETLGQDAAEQAKKSFEASTAAMKTLASVKSPTEFMKLQSDYARSAFDTMVADMSRSTEMMLKLAGEIAQPISNRVALAADKMKIAA